MEAPPVEIVDDKSNEEIAEIMGDLLKRVSLFISKAQQIGQLLLHLSLVQ